VNPRWLGLALLLAGLLGFLAITRSVLHVQAGTGLDVWVSGWFAPWIEGHPGWMRAFWRIFGYASFTLSVGLGLYLPIRWWRRGERAAAVFMWFNAWSGTALWVGMIYTFERIRPVPIIGGLPGYPSGHTMSMFTIYAALLVIFFVALRRRGRAWQMLAAWAIWSALNGFGRLYMEFHYPTDVLAGYALGAAWLGLSILLLPLPKPPRRL
jgi:membrane-associated phospholipid phosphatase